MKTQERLKLVQELLVAYDNDMNYGVSSVSIEKLKVLKRSFEDELRFEQYMQEVFGKDFDNDFEDWLY